MSSAASTSAPSSSSSTSSSSSSSSVLALNHTALNHTDDVASKKSGQKLATPSPGAGDRVFYESLYAEKGIKSEMAVRWIIEHGVLPGPEHEKLYKDVYLKLK
jgi:hypothetical protein